MVPLSKYYRCNNPARTPVLCVLGKYIKAQWPNPSGFIYCCLKSQTDSTKRVAAGMFWLSVMLSWKYRSHFSTSIFVFISIFLSFFLMSGVSEPALHLGQWNSTLYLPLDAANVSNVVCSMISIFLTSSGHVCTPLLLNTLVLKKTRKKTHSYWKRETESGRLT